MSERKGKKLAKIYLSKGEIAALQDAIHCMPDWPYAPGDYPPLESAAYKMRCAMTLLVAEEAGDKHE